MDALAGGGGVKANIIWNAPANVPRYLRYSKLKHTIRCRDVIQRALGTECDGGGWSQTLKPGTLLLPSVMTTNAPTTTCR